MCLVQNGVSYLNVLAHTEKQLLKAMDRRLSKGYGTQCTQSQPVRRKRRMPLLPHFVFSYSLFFFPLNFCALLAQDTGHLRTYVTYQASHTYLKSEDLSAGGNPIHTTLERARSLLLPCIKHTPTPSFCYVLLYQTVRDVWILSASINLM